MAFYVEWLGFDLDWEWRRDPDAPAIVHVSRDGQAVFLTEDGGGSVGARLNVTVTDLEAYAAELNSRRPGSATVYLEPPYDIPSIRLSDPFGNQIGFQQLPSVSDQQDMDTRASEMREYIRQHLADHGEIPTPEHLVKNSAGPVGLAIQVITEFSTSRK